MSIRTSIIVVLTIAIGVLACKKTDGDEAGDASSKPTGTSTTSAPASGSFGPDSVTVDFAGKFVDSDGEKQLPVFKVTNKSDKDVFYLKVWYYYYDGAKKQLDRRFAERYSLNMKPGASQEMPLAFGKDKVKGDVKTVQAVVVGATYANNGKWDGDVKTLAPDQRTQK